MLEAVALVAHLLVPPLPDWTERKRLLRARLEQVVRTGNRVYARDDLPPQLTLARLPGQHGEFDHDWNRLTLDLESLHDPGKFWHVYRNTVPHEWAHGLNARMHHERGHGERFERIVTALRAED